MSTSVLLSRLLSTKLISFNLWVCPAESRVLSALRLNSSTSATSSEANLFQSFLTTVIIIKPLLYDVAFQFY